MGNTLSTCFVIGVSLLKSDSVYGATFNAKYQGNARVRIECCISTTEPEPGTEHKLGLDCAEPAGLVAGAELDQAADPKPCSSPGWQLFPSGGGCEREFFHNGYTLREADFIRKKEACLQHGTSFVVTTLTSGGTQHPPSQHVPPQKPPPGDAPHLGDRAAWGALGDKMRQNAPGARPIDEPRRSPEGDGGGRAARPAPDPRRS